MEGTEPSLSLQNAVYIAPPPTQTRYGSPHGRKQSLGIQPPTTHQEITPPPTPHGSQESLALFESKGMSFLRAYFPFTPPFNPSETATITLPLTTGDVILVHSVHTNGWADGTILSSGARGWLPTNYCESYEPEEIRNLLNACLGLFEKFRAGGAGSIGDASMVANVVAGVKSLLESTDCRTRESTTVASNNMVRRTRKQVLAELSALVKSAKKIPQQPASPETSPKPVEQLESVVDEVILKIFKLLIRAIRFLDAWLDHQDSLQTKLNSNIPPTPPAESENRTFALGENSSPRERIDRNTVASPTFTNMSQCSTTFPSCFVTRPGSDYASSIHYPERKASQLLKITFEELLPLMGHYIERLQTKPQHKITVQTGGYKLISCTSVFLNLVECVIDKHAVIGPLCESFDTLNSTIRDVSIANDEIVIVATDEKLDEPTSARLLDLAVRSVRIACDCVARAGNVLSTIGDFDLDDVEMLQRNRWIGQEELLRKSPVVQPLNEEDVSKASEFSEDGSVSEPTRPVTAIDIDSKELPPPPPPPKDKATTGGKTSELRNEVDDAPTLPQDGTNPGKCEGSTAGGSSIIIMQEPEMATLAQTSSLTPSTPPTTPSLSRKPSYLEANLLSRENSLNGRPSSRLDSMASAGLLLNKDGNVSGGTLAALVERLTMHDSTPEVTFVNAFYITFRCFATPMDFAEALIERFDSVANEADVVAIPVRLRVYNVFKGWLECHWQKDTDEVILPLLEKFAEEQLLKTNAMAGQRMKELTQKVASVGGPLVPRMVGAIGSAHLSTTETFPSPVVTRNQLNALKRPQTVSITDLDPLEIARQLAIKTGKIFCSIMPEELLSQTWIKHPERAPNVKAMAVLATKITRIVAESILFEDDMKKRANNLKQWIKVADKCLEMSNYDSAMAITTSLESSCISRLKRTWDEVPLKHKATLERLREVMGCAKNYTVLRARVRDHVPPCIPFIGPFLTDLTFIEDGNPATRPLSLENPSEGHVINFDKYLKTSRIIMDIQRFQVPYPFQEIPEIQCWFDFNIGQLADEGDSRAENTLLVLYRRSLVIEPKMHSLEHQTSNLSTTTTSTSTTSRAFDLFGWAKSSS